MKSIEIHRGRPLAQEPQTGHNRLHPDIPPIMEVDVGEEVVFPTRNASDYQVTPSTLASDLPKNNMARVHPLTGPVYIRGAQPGDLLEVEFLDIEPDDWGFTSMTPGRGSLPDLVPAPYLAHWQIDDGWATSPQLKGVRIPGAPFPGVAVVAPSHAQLRAWNDREEAIRQRGGFALAPNPEAAVPSRGPAASDGLRTLPPRENGGNMDVKQLTKGAKLSLPVSVAGALFSTGDAHFAQGDGEVCLTAVEMDATVAVRFRLYKGEAQRRNIRGPRIVRDDYFADPRWAVPRRFTSTMGIPVGNDGENVPGDLNLACRNALIAMVELLQERGWSWEQAFVICSVAVDLRISQVVDLPNPIVSALLPEDIFAG